MKKLSNKDELTLNEITKLTKIINYYDDLYYNKNDQEITDHEYDELRKKLEKLEKKYPHLIREDSPIHKVGSRPSKQLKAIKHKIPMLSLNNAYNIREIEKFYEKNKKIFNDFNILAETKVDGLSASLRYKSRKLVLALTRGDGMQGEDISNNIKFVEGVKEHLPIGFPDDLEIRGEIFMPKASFYRLNEEREKNGDQKFSTARNAASGSIRQLDPMVTKSRKLSFYGYTVLTDDSFFGSSLSNTRKVLEKYNFSLNLPCTLCKNIKEMIDFYVNISESRDNLDYEIDGIVYKIDSYEQQKKLGFTSRSPRWALAHKFPAENITTKLLNVNFQVGRTGIITPVAELEEATIGGVKINRSTLHNEDEVKRLGIRIGDTITLQRAGDVIPKIINVIISNRNGSEKEINFPKKCPSCNKGLKKSKKEVALRCLNYEGCKEQIIHRIRHFVSRKGFNIDGLGEKQIRLFWYQGIIRNFNDIFGLEKNHKIGKINLLKYEGWGEKSIYNLFKAIKKSSTIDFDRFIYSLGIRNVGSEIATILSKNFDNVEEFLKTFSKKNLQIPLEFDGIGETIIKSLYEFFDSTSRVILIKNLISHLNIIYSQPVLKGIFLHKRVAITGSFANFSRKKIEKKLIMEGAKIVNLVTKNVDFVIAGESPGSKLDKAKSLNINIKGNDFIKKIMKR